MQCRVAFWLLLVPIAMAMTACRAGAPTNGTTEVQISAAEFKFEAPQTTFRMGTPYRFVVKNTGQLEHEWLIMPRGERDEEKALIEVEEDELPAGRTVSKVVTFSQAGDFEFACHLPGHYEGGMVLPIVVR